MSALEQRREWRGSGQPLRRHERREDALALRPGAAHEPSRSTSARSAPARPQRAAVGERPASARARGAGGRASAGARPSTPLDSTARSGPTGSAQTTAAASKRSPVACVTVHPAAATLDARDRRCRRRTRWPSSSAIRSATVAEPSATRSALPHLVRRRSRSLARGGLLAQLGQQRRALDVDSAERPSMESVARADDRRRGAVRAQPRRDARGVEPRGVRVRPRVVGVDRRARARRTPSSSARRPRRARPG